MLLNITKLYAGNSMMNDNEKLYTELELVFLYLHTNCIYCLLNSCPQHKDAVK